MQDVVRGDAKMLSDTVAVGGPALQRAQDQQVESTREQIRRLIRLSHRLSIGVWVGSGSQDWTGRGLGVGA